MEKVKELDDKRTVRFWKLYGEERVQSRGMVIGTTASPGKAVGRVRVIIDPFKAKNFKQNSVLVAPMTSPEYVFLMKKSSAIVTDTGGLTSHAAIISRELGKPCIVGTKVATKIFKDGDMVEVDANKGAVKKL